MFHQEYKGDIPYAQPEKPVEGHQDAAQAPHFQDGYNAPRTGLNQTAVQDYVGINDREKQNAETANENSNDYYSNEEINNCLLYTSPSPRDLSTSRMPSSA